MFVNEVELSLMTGLSVRKIRQLTRQGILTTVDESGIKEQTPEELEAELTELVSTEELADILSVTPRRILQYVQDKVLNGVKVEGKKGWYFYKIAAMCDMFKYVRERREDRVA